MFIRAVRRSGRWFPERGCILEHRILKCASRHNGVQFFISHLASWLRTRRFSEPTFRPSGATNHWKNPVFRYLPTFSRASIFCLLRLSLFDLLCSSLLFSSLTLPISALHLSIWSEVWLLNFLRIGHSSLEPSSNYTIPKGLLTSVRCRRAWRFPVDRKVAQPLQRLSIADTRNSSFVRFVGSLCERKLEATWRVARNLQCNLCIVV